MPPALHTRSLWRPKCREAKNELLLCRCRRLGFAHEALDHFARAPQRGPQVEVADVPLALLEIRPQSLVALKTGMGGRGAVGQQSAPGSRLDADRQEEHRDEEHGQVHCVDTVSAHGQGDGESRASRAASFQCVHTVEARGQSEVKRRWWLTSSRESEVRGEAARDARGRSAAREHAWRRQRGAGQRLKRL